MQKPIRGDHRLGGNLESVVFTRHFGYAVRQEELYQGVVMIQASCGHNEFIRGWIVNGEAHARCTLCGLTYVPTGAMERWVEVEQ